MGNINLGTNDKPIWAISKEINEFRHYLSSNPHFSEANVDTHISLMYSSNKVAVGEFLIWRDSKEE